MNMTVVMNEYSDTRDYDSEIRIDILIEKLDFRLITHTLEFERLSDLLEKIHVFKPTLCTHSRRNSEKRRDVCRIIKDCRLYLKFILIKNYLYIFIVLLVR